MCVEFDCHSEWSCLLQLQFKKGFVFDMWPFWQQIFYRKIGSYYKVEYISNVRILESHFLFVFKRHYNSYNKTCIHLSPIILSIIFFSNLIIFDMF